MFYFRPEIRTNTRDPGMCAYHHVLIPGRFRVNFLHCKCPAMLPGIGGHNAWYCQDCDEEGRGGEAWLYPAGHEGGGMDWMNPWKTDPTTPSPF